MSVISSSVAIDWLTINQAYCPVIQTEKTEVVRSPVPFYESAVRWVDTGVMASHGNKKSPGSWLVTIPGDALTRYGWDNELAVDFLRARLSEGGKVSRLDMAVTIETGDASWTVDHVLSLVRDGRAKMPHSRVGHVKSIRNELTGHSETAYIGDMRKRARRGIVRVYDKGLEQGLSALRKTRVEIEEKRAVAHTCARRIVETGSIGQVVKTRFNLDDPVWTSVVGASAAPLTRDTSGSHSPDTWHWLIETVAPVLGRSIAQSEDDGDKNRDLFFDAVWRAYEGRVLRGSKPQPVDNKHADGIVWV